MAEVRHNKQTGESVMFDGQAWVPTKTVRNKQTGESLAFDGQAWVSVGVQQQPQQSGIADVVRPADKQNVEPYSGTLLPFTKDESGNISFDSNAGIVGMFKRGFSVPGDVLTGKLDLNSPEATPRLLEAAAMMSPVGAASRVAGSVFAPKSAYKTVTPKAPTREALKSATDAGYKKVADLDVRYAPGAIEKMAVDLENSLNEKGLIEGLKGVKDVHTLLQTLKGGPADSYVKMASLDAFRQRLGEIAGSPKKQVASAASEAIRAVDDFIASPNPANLVGRAAPGGQGLAPQGYRYGAADAAANRAAAQEASDAVLKARSNAAAGFRSDQIAKLQDKVEMRAAAANSGMNVDNTIRQKLASMLENPKQMRGLSAEETQAIKDIVKGTPTKNAIRYLGNLMGGGGGMGQALWAAAPAATVGLSGGSPGTILASMVPAAVGAGSKMLANAASKKELSALEAMMRSRSALGASQGGAKQVYAPNPGGEAMLRALMLQSATNPQMPIDMNMQNALGAN